MTESESPGNGIAVQEMYLIVLKRFLMKLDHADAAASPLKSPSTASIMLHRQYTFVSALTSVMAEVSARVPQTIPFSNEVAVSNSGMILTAMIMNLVVTCRLSGNRNCRGRAS